VAVLILSNLLLEIDAILSLSVAFERETVQVAQTVRLVGLIMLFCPIFLALFVLGSEPGNKVQEFTDQLFGTGKSAEIE
jgi:hypothetical protein